MTKRAWKKERERERALKKDRERERERERELKKERENMFLWGREQGVKAILGQHAAVKNKI